jgi:hypothetical protein
LRHKNLEFKASLGYRVRLCLKTTTAKTAGHPWLTPDTLATWEAEIGRIEVQGQPRQIVLKTPFPE